MPVVSVAAGSGAFSHDMVTSAAVAEHVTAITLDDVGHLAAMEDPNARAQELLGLDRLIDVD